MNSIKSLLSLLPVILLWSSGCSQEEIMTTGDLYLSIPDANFEGRLIELGIDTDSTLNQQVLKSDAERVSHLALGRSDTFGKIEDLTGIEGFFNLTFLAVKYQKIVEVNLSANRKLDTLDLTGNLLSHLDISSNTDLIWLNAPANELHSIEGISEASNLRSLDLSYNLFENLTITSESLGVLSLSSNLLRSLQVTGAPNLQSAILTLNELSTLDLSSNIQLETLLISANRLSEIDLSENTALQVLYISSNMLEHLDVSQNQQLWDLRPDRNPELNCIKTSVDQIIPTTRLSDHQELSPRCGS